MSQLEQKVAQLTFAQRNCSINWKIEFLIMGETPREFKFALTVSYLPDSGLFWNMLLILTFLLYLMYVCKPKVIIKPKYFLNRPYDVLAKDVIEQPPFQWISNRDCVVIAIGKLNNGSSGHQLNSALFEGLVSFHLTDIDSRPLDYGTMFSHSIRIAYLKTIIEYPYFYRLEFNFFV